LNDILRLMDRMNPQKAAQQMISPDMGGSANAATGSGGDVAGGVSGTGGIGGSATAGEGGSAAAGTTGGAAEGVGGSDAGSGTYARGGGIDWDAVLATLTGQPGPWRSIRNDPAYSTRGSDSTSPFVAGAMRGGYPELYNQPIRKTFDSGGENYVQGYGDSSGRADDVNAKLSNKEYVVDSETMSLLGDGNPDAGAKKMDQFRQNVRRHKGAALAKGKFSPNAKKNPMEYLAGDPAGDGVRRSSRKNP